MLKPAPQGVEIASARKNCDFSAREVSPAAIFYENVKISNSAPDLDLPKSHVKQIVWDSAAQPK